MSKSESSYQFEREEGNVYEFDQEGKLCSQKDRNGNDRRFTYNSNGLLECVGNGTGEMDLSRLLLFDRQPEIGHRS